MAFDILKPQISKVSKGLEGKTILIYGSNSLGKTYQATRMEKPLVLPFEDGIEAIDGIPYFPINEWKDFKEINKGLTNKKTVEQAKEMYKTLIFDEVYASAQMCQKYICNLYGAAHMGEQAPKGTNRPNLYTAYEREYRDEITKLTKAGYTVIFIGHQTVDNDTKQIIPKGDKRSMELIRDMAGVTLYVASNGIGEDGRAVFSSGYTVETADFFARSRYTEMIPKIATFTAENLEKALIEAIEKDEQKRGSKAVTFEERAELMSTETIDLEKYKSEAQHMCIQLAEGGFQVEAEELMYKHLGIGNKISEVLPRQAEALAVLHSDLVDLKEEKGI